MCSPVTSSYFLISHIELKSNGVCPEQASDVTHHSLVFTHIQFLCAAHSAWSLPVRKRRGTHMNAHSCSLSHTLRRTFSLTLGSCQTCNVVITYTSEIRSNGTDFVTPSTWESKEVYSISNKQMFSFAEAIIFILCLYLIHDFWFILSRV